jgi:hypothetical protein
MKSTKPPARPLPATVQPDVLPPCPDIGTFMRRLAQLQIDARQLYWHGEPLTRINASALCALIARAIEE